MSDILQFFGVMFIGLGLLGVFTLAGLTAVLSGILFLAGCVLLGCGTVAVAVERLRAELHRAGSE